MSFATVQKTIELIFSLFPFDAIVVYPNVKYRTETYTTFIMARGARDW